jgi:hypothetical protein
MQNFLYNNSSSYPPLFILFFFYIFSSIHHRAITAGTGDTLVKPPELKPTDRLNPTKSANPSSNEIKLP